MNITEQKIVSLGLQLPTVARPVANYVPTVIVCKNIYVSGQLPFENGVIKYVGKVGEAITLEQGKEAAALCALNILAQVKAALGSLDKVKQCVKITGFVNATPDFTHHPQVLNGASDLIVAIFGEKGRHARAAVGVSSLPLGTAVEIEAIFEIEPA